MDTSGIEPDPSRKFSERMLSERDNQLHHVPLLSASLFQSFRTSWLVRHFLEVQVSGLTFLWIPSVPPCTDSEEFTSMHNDSVSVHEHGGTDYRYRRSSRF